MKSVFYWSLLLGVILMTSCNIEKRLPNYLQHVNDSSILREVKIPELRIQKNDMLNIIVYSSSTNREVADELYNLPNRVQNQGGQSAMSSTSTFLVDVNGNINYPEIGIIHAEGMTRLQLEDTIKVRINAQKEMLNNPKVAVRFQNLRVLVMGEVKQQGPISIPGERVTILEAIGLAGGTTDYAVRQKVKIVREIDGKREMGYVDLSSNDLFTSPYYSLMQNDVVVVDPIPRKTRNLIQNEVMQQLGWVISIVTTALLIYNVFK
jgi:polysaccharide export outer membrane protein